MAKEKETCANCWEFRKAPWVDNAPKYGWKNCPHAGAVKADDEPPCCRDEYGEWVSMWLSIQFGLLNLTDFGEKHGIVPSSTEHGDDHKP